MSIRPRPGSASARPASSRRRVFRAVQGALRSQSVVQPQQGLARAGESLEGDMASTSLSGESTEVMAGPLPPADLQGTLFRESLAPFGPGRFGARDRPAPGHLRGRGERGRGVLHRPARSPRARALRAAQARAASGPLASQELLFPQPLELGPGKAALLARVARTISSGSASPSRASAEAACSSAPCPCSSRARSHGASSKGSSTRWGRPRRSRDSPLVDRALSFVACRAAIKAHAPLHGRR